MNQEFVPLIITLVFYLGILIGIIYGKNNEYIGYTEKEKEWNKGYKIGYRKGKEEAEKTLIEKLKKLKKI